MARSGKTANDMTKAEIHRLTSNSGGIDEMQSMMESIMDVDSGRESGTRTEIRRRSAAGDEAGAREAARKSKPLRESDAGEAHPDDMWPFDYDGITAPASYSERFLTYLIAHEIQYNIAEMIVPSESGGEFCINHVEFPPVSSRPGENHSVVSAINMRAGKDGAVHEFEVSIPEIAEALGIDKVSDGVWRIPVQAVANSVFEWARDKADEIAAAARALEKNAETPVSETREYRAALLESNDGRGIPTTRSRSIPAGCSAAPPTTRTGSCS